MEERVAHLTLSRPPLNVLTIEMISQLSAAIEPLSKREDLCALVIMAAGEHFSAGVDVGEHRPDTVRLMLQSFHHLIRCIHRFPCPVIAGVHGHTLGGGMELACVCDITVAATNVRMGLPEITLAVYPPVAVAQLHRRVGDAVAADLIYTGRLLSADEALTLGLVSRLCEPGDLQRVVREVANRLSTLSAHALRCTKEAFRRSAQPDFESALAETESFYLERLMKGKDPLEGLASFLEKRSPHWTHQ